AIHRGSSLLQKKLGRNSAGVHSSNRSTRLSIAPGSGTKNFPADIRIRSIGTVHNRRRNVRRRMKKRPLQRALLILDKQLFAITDLSSSWLFPPFCKSWLAEPTRSCVPLRDHRRLCNTRLPACPVGLPTK